MSTLAKNPAWTGTNLYVHLLLLVGSLFGGMSNDTAGIIVAGGSGVVAAFFAIRNWVVNAHFATGKKWIGDPNNWTYLTAALTAIVPAASGLIQPLHSLADAIVSGNLGSILTAGFALLSLVYYTLIKPKK